MLNAWVNFDLIENVNQKLIIDLIKLIIILVSKQMSIFIIIITCHLWQAIGIEQAISKYLSPGPIFLAY